MKSWQALALIILVWAGLYLPYLGSVELRGEEARRILPGRTMMQTGEWIVPSIGGEVYNRKPPLINWTIAGSFALTGVQNEWTARLPSVLWLLAFGILAFLVLQKRLGIWGAACVPLFFLSTIGMLDKGRMAEIEAMYIAQFGIAYVLWAHLWAQGKNWAAFLVSGLVLGVATLAKGPIHIFFWYPIVGFALWRARELKDLIRPPHLMGLALMFAVFLPWMLMNMERLGESTETTGVWWEQLASRIRYTSVNFGDWLAHPFQIVSNFLPWSILLILAWWRVTPALKQAPRTDRWVAVIRGSQFGILLGAGVLLLTPEGLPRYSMPLFAPATLVLVCLWQEFGDASRREAFTRASQSGPKLLRGLLGVWNGLLNVSEERLNGWWRRGNFALLLVSFLVMIVGAFVVRALGYPISPWLILTSILFAGAVLYVLLKRPQLPLLVASCIVLASALASFHSVAVPLKASREKFRPAGHELASATSELDRPLILYDPGHLRFIFYVDRPYVEIANSSELPDQSGYFLIQPKHLERKSVQRYLEKYEWNDLGTWEWEGREFTLLDLELTGS